MYRSNCVKHFLLPVPPEVVVSNGLSVNIFVYISVYHSYLKNKARGRQHVPVELREDPGADDAGRVRHQPVEGDGPERDAVPDVPRQPAPHRLRPHRVRLWRARHARRHPARRQNTHR